MKNRLPYLLLIVALGLICLQRFSTAGIPIFNVDEAVSAVVAQEIAEGGLPYKDAIDHRGPLTYYFYALIFQVFGDWNMGVVHGIYALILCLISCLLFVIDREIGAWGGLLFAVFSWTHPPMDMWAAHTEWLLILGTSLGMLILVRGKNHPIWLGLAGVCIGLAALSKQVAVWELVAVGGWILWKNGKLPLPWGKLLLQGGAVLLGFVVPIVGLALYFSAHAAWEDFLFYVWEYNVAYYLPEVTLLERISSSMALIVSFFGGSVLLAVLCLGGMMDACLRRDSLSDWEKLLLCWVLGSLLGGLTSGRNFGHYAIQWLPSVCMLAGWGWRVVWMNAKTERGKDWQLFLLGLLVLGLTLPLGDTLVKNKVYLESAFVQDPQPAPYIRANSDPDDRIFVWGFAPAFYLFSERRPATRFVYCNVLTGLVPWENLHKPSTAYAEVPGTWDQLMDDLERHSPTFILDTSPADYNSYGKYPISNYPRLSDWISKYYHRDTSYLQQYPSSPYHLYRRNP